MFSPYNKFVASLSKSHSINCTINKLLRSVNSHFIKSFDWDTKQLQTMNGRDHCSKYLSKKFYSFA